jgi:mannose-6-phosphate isomerase-like protein (cupin superfamily)
MPSFSIFKADQLRSLSSRGPDQRLFRSERGELWSNLVVKDSRGPLVAESHDREIDIYLVIEGEAALHLGGTLVEPTSPEPYQHRGQGLEGAELHRIAAGDAVFIGAGVPHLIDASSGRLVYLVVKHLVPSFALTCAPPEE